MKITARRRRFLFYLTTLTIGAIGGIVDWYLNFKTPGPAFIAVIFLLLLSAIVDIYTDVEIPPSRT